MKQLSTAAIVLFFVTASWGQNGNDGNAPVACKNLKDSASYAMGYNIGQGLMRQNMDPDIIIAAIRDAFAGKTAVINVSAAQTVVQSYYSQEAKKKTEVNREAGRVFLAANAKKTGVVSTPSGLQYQVIKMGTGPKPKVSDKVKVNYSGTLINGKEFDNSNHHGGPAELNLGGVIAGWTEVLQLMPVGSKFRVYIPSQLGYGDNDVGADIPGGSALIFEIELLDIIK